MKRAQNILSAITEHIDRSKFLNQLRNGTASEDIIYRVINEIERLPIEVEDDNCIDTEAIVRVIAILHVCFIFRDKAFRKGTESHKSIERLYGTVSMYMMGLRWER